MLFGRDLRCWLDLLRLACVFPMFQKLPRKFINWKSRDKLQQSSRNTFLRSKLPKPTIQRTKSNLKEINFTNLNNWENVRRLNHRISNKNNFRESYRCSEIPRDRHFIYVVRVWHAGDCVLFPVSKFGIIRDRSSHVEEAIQNGGPCRLCELFRRRGNWTTNKATEGSTFGLVLE